MCFYQSDLCLLIHPLRDEKPPSCSSFCQHPHNLLKASGSLLSVTIVRRWCICVFELSDTGRQKWSLHTHCSPAVVCSKQTERWCYSGLGQLYELWEAATLQTITGRLASYRVSFLSVAMMKRQTSLWDHVQRERMCCHVFYFTIEREKMNNLTPFLFLQIQNQSPLFLFDFKLFFNL